VSAPIVMSGAVSPIAPESARMIPGRIPGKAAGGLQYQYSHNAGTTRHSQEAATASNSFGFNTELGWIRPAPPRLEFTPP
jgi:hypothetical protein